MKKINIDAVLVVEGKSDVSYLSSFINTYFFITNGYDLSEEKINFLKEASKVRKLIIFTDNDVAGEQIRNRIKNEINNVFDAKSEKIVRNNYKKSGVAESSKEAVIEALKLFACDYEITRHSYELVNIISLSEEPCKYKENLINKYRLISGNIKSLENQLNILNISPEEVEDNIRGN